MKIWHCTHISRTRLKLFCSANIHVSNCTVFSVYVGPNAVVGPKRNISVLFCASDRCNINIWIHLSCAKLWTIWIRVESGEGDNRIWCLRGELNWGWISHMIIISKGDQNEEKTKKKINDIIVSCPVLCLLYFLCPFCIICNMSATLGSLYVLYIHICCVLLVCSE